MTIRSYVKPVDIVNVRITHKTANVPLLEAVAFKDKTKAYEQIHSLEGVQEAVLIQTCNRIELYLISEDGEKTTKAALAYLYNRAAAYSGESVRSVEHSTNREALEHLLKVACGLESMVIGEDQIINQVWNAYLEAEKAKAAGPVLGLLFNRAVNVGRRVRSETGISKGAVSVGSAAVELAEKMLESLNDKKILVLGAGETATLVAKAMARRCLSPIFIANRTYERAVRLAEELGGRAVKFDKLNEVLVDADVVFCSTAAPHYLLTNEMVSKTMKNRQNRKGLLVIDLSNPRNVEEKIKALPHVELFNIDDLAWIAQCNKQERQKSVKEAFRIVGEELELLDRAVKADSIRGIVSELLAQVEQTRRRELGKALSLMGKLDERQRKIVGNLTSSVLKKTFLPVVENFRLAAEKSDMKLIEAAAKLF